MKSSEKVSLLILILKKAIALLQKQLYLTITFLWISGLCIDKFNRDRTIKHAKLECVFQMTNKFYKRICQIAESRNPSHLLTVSNLYLMH